MQERDDGFFFYQPIVVRRRVRRRRRRVRRPRWTMIFICICTAMFIIDSMFEVWPYLSFTPAYVSAQPWTIITSIFMHADILHLIFNMLALFMFGLYLESRVTERQFLFIFFATGILGNFAYWLSAPYGVIPAVGASGAVYGVMGMLATLYPGLIVYYFGAPIPIIFAAFLWFFMEFSGMFTPSNVAHQAHLAGLIGGVLYGLYVRKRRKKLVFFWER